MSVPRALCVRAFNQLNRRLPKVGALVRDLHGAVERDHSQHGEQGLLQQVLPRYGTYLDIGCHQRPPE